MNFFIVCLYVWGDLLKCGEQNMTLRVASLLLPCETPGINKGRTCVVRYDSKRRNLLSYLASPAILLFLSSKNFFKLCVCGGGGLGVYMCI